MTLGEVVKDYRKKNHLSLRVFGARCNLSFQHISAIENEVYKNPSLETIENLAKGMDMSVHSLMSLLGETGVEYEHQFNNDAISKIQNSLIESIVNNLKQMTTDKQQQVLEYTQFLMTKGEQ